ncbi:MAG: twin transmembrane helix small protein [Aestuariivita sp.]|nr:twin transmembrane helix small protein [Aestuariivita sp.]
MDPLFLMILLLVSAVVIILAIGIGSFAKGGTFNRKHSNKMMKLRLIAQFLAVIFILLFVFLAQRGG